jgi:hypothetical protein
VNRLVLVARLRPDARPKAERLLELGPPFDPGRVGMTRHLVFLGAETLVFLFEGPDVEWTVEDLVDNPIIAASLEPWRPLVVGEPAIAEERYAWEHAPAGDAAGSQNP